MNQPPLSIPANLLQHEPFVRAVVRGVLADAGQADDAVQETWIRALRRAPGEGPIGGWLARVARNVARDWNKSAARRRARERAALRAEGSVEPIDVTQSRLSAQRAVVGAVLALAEPYQTVVLLRYYQELTPAEIGARLGRSAATVRSQLSRAHELLRSDLDGEGAAWSALAQPALHGTSWIELLLTAAGTTSGRAVAGVAALALAGVWVARLAGASGPAGGARAQPVRVAAAEPVRADPLLAPAGGRAEAEPRTAVPASAQAAPPRDERPDLDELTLRELYELAVQTQRAVERQVLTPAASWLAESSPLLARPDTGVARLVNGNGSESDLAHALTLRGGGSFYSFARRSHDYDDDPDVAFTVGAFDCGFYGNQLGLIAALGDVALEDLPSSAEPVSASLTAEQRDAWRVLWQELALGDAEHTSNFRARTAELQRSIVPAGTGQTFLLRVYSPHEHDHLVAFRPLALDAGGCTLAWRILRTWPVPGEKQQDYVKPDLGVAPGPAWLEGLALEELLSLLKDLRAHAAEPLFGVPRALQERYAGLAAAAATSFADASGFARILHRGRWDALVELRGGGAYYSFLSRSNSYDEQPELQLEQGRYSSGFAGNDRGLLLDLGAVPFSELGAVMAGGAPAGLSARERAAFDFLWTVRAQGGEPRALAEADAARAVELGFTWSLPALVGHTYLLRAVQFTSHDHLVAFTVISGDELGHTLAWRVLKSWPVER